MKKYIAVITIILQLGWSLSLGHSAELGTARSRSSSLSPARSEVKKPINQESLPPAITGRLEVGSASSSPARPEVKKPINRESLPRPITDRLEVGSSSSSPARSAVKKPINQESLLRPITDRLEVGSSSSSPARSAVKKPIRRESLLRPITDRLRVGSEIIKVVERKDYDPCDFNKDGAIDELETAKCEAEHGAERERHDPCDLNEDGIVDGWEAAECMLGPEPTRNEVATITVPVFMYYLERYFSDVTDKTETDMVIRSILDESPEGQKFLQEIFENYRAIPESTKYQIFDEETVQLTSAATLQLDLDYIRDRIKFVKPDKSWKVSGPAAAPSALVAKNASAPPDPDISGSEKYQIQLKWQDNSNDEHGFLVYRSNYYTIAGLKFQLIAKVGPNVTTYIDSLTKPPVKDDQYCYQVVAFKTSPIAPIGQSPILIESEPSNTACSYYIWSYPPPPPPQDSDKDGLPDQYDKCPYEHDGGASWTEGCPDDDGDGVPNKDDKCKLLRGDSPVAGDTGPKPPAGCPYKYNLRWMGMKILNNSGAYAYPGYTFTYDNGKKDPTNEGGDPKDNFGYGEEPYLFFAFLNGMTQKGMKEHGATRWCCGERVDVKKGKDFEPDNDSSGEEHPLKLQDLLDHGLTVFPAISGKFAEIDHDLGLSMTVTLMERDWTALITPEEKASALAAAFKVGGAVAGAIGGCVGSGGFGCLLSVGAAMKTVIESLFGFLQTPPPPIEIEDPDDYMGTDVWAITRAEAKFKTVDDGAYAFWFDTPTPYFKSCLGWQPCPAGAGVPTTMRAKLYFCLYREGIPESQIKKACTPFEQVLPWPMAAK